MTTQIEDIAEIIAEAEAQIRDEQFKEAVRIEKRKILLNGLKPLYKRLFPYRLKIVRVD